MSIEHGHLERRRRTRDRRASNTLAGVDDVLLSQTDHPPDPPDPPGPPDPPDHDPDPIEDVLGPLVRSAAIIAAAQLGVFAALTEPRSLTDLADHLAASENGLSALLDVLTLTDYVHLEEGRYRLGSRAEKWLSPASAVDLTPALWWGGELWTIFGDLGDAVRRGRPAMSVWDRMARRPEIGALFSRFMKAKAQLTVEAIADVVTPPTNARRMLDLGGSHGLHTSALCRRHPELSSTIFDLPAALTQTMPMIEAAGLDDRVRIREGDYLVDPLGDDYDIVLCFELLHGHPPDENVQLLQRIREALQPGGQLLILEELRPDDLDMSSAAFSLAMFVFTATRTYRQDEIATWLRAHGFSTPIRHDLPHGAMSLLTTTKV